MRTVIVLFAVVLALALAPVAAAERPSFAGNTGNFDNCAGVFAKGAPHSDFRNFNPGNSFHACD